MSGFQHKMYNYEVTPPAGVWEKIAAELDESELEHQFPSRLHDLEILPPATAWQKITTSLDAEHEGFIPDKRRLSPFLRYAAAAAIIGFLVWGGLQLLNNNKSDNTEVVKNDGVKAPENIATPETTHVDNPVNNTPVTDIAVSNDDARNDAALEASKKTYASLSVPARSKIKNVSDFYFAPDNMPTGTTRGFDVNDYFPAGTDVENNISDRYIMLMTPEGNIIRMSKKLGNLVCCVSGEEQDDDCIRQMKKWRDKMATPSAGHSSGNFMDILSLLNSLQENNL